MSIGHNSIQAHDQALPAGVQDIADVFGLGMVFALVEHFGGRELRIPHKLKSDHELLALGQTRALQLCEFCPEDTINVPISLDRHRVSKRLKRNVDELSKQGFKRGEIAQKLGITQRHVRRLANRGSGVDPRQMDLFPDEGS